MLKMFNKIIFNRKQKAVYTDSSLDSDESTTEIVNCFCLKVQSWSFLLFSIWVNNLLQNVCPEKSVLFADVTTLTVFDEVQT